MMVDPFSTKVICEVTMFAPMLTRFGYSSYCQFALCDISYKYFLIPDATMTRKAKV